MWDEAGICMNLRAHKYRPNHLALRDQQKKGEKLDGSREKEMGIWGWLIRAMCVS